MRSRDGWSWGRLTVAGAIMAAGLVETFTGDALAGFVVTAAAGGALAIDTILRRLDELTGHTGGTCTSAIPLVGRPEVLAVCRLEFGHHGWHEDGTGMAWVLPDEPLSGFEGARRG